MVERWVGLLALAALGACAEAPTPQSRPDGFGVAVRNNMQAQIIAEEGEVTTLGPAPGERRSLTVDRYQTDQVEQPADLFTRGE